MARYGPESHQVAGATSTSRDFALMKAAVEATERAISERVVADYTGSALDCPEKCLSPDDYIPLTDEQIKHAGLKRFSVDDSGISWKSGFWQPTGEKILAPVDMIYYGYQTEGKRLYYANSSGVAAHTSFQEAVERAKLELIERDRLMRVWFSKMAPPQLPDYRLPFHTRKRRRYWKEHYGYDLTVFDLSFDIVDVFLVTLSRKEEPCFFSGAAAGCGTFDQTVHKALAEAEYNLLLRLNHPVKNTMTPKQVVTPSDHGLLYQRNRYFKQLEWLWEGELATVGARGVPSMDAVLPQRCPKNHYGIFELSNGKDPVEVVRVVSPDLVPISFGYGMGHYTHPALKGIKIPESQIKMPHFFA